MAESRESVILDVKLDAQKVADDLTEMAKKINDLKIMQNALNSEIADGKDVNGEYQKKLIEVKNELSWTQKQAKGLSATTRLLNADSKTYSDTLNGQRQKLADMQKAYDQMDASMRDSDGGRAFLQALKEQHDAVLELEGATGRMQRNVGNYPKVFAPAIGKVDELLGKFGTSLDDISEKGAGAFKGMATGAKSFGKAMITPPVGVVVVILGAILAVVNKLREAFKRNDEATTNLQRAFSALEPIAKGLAFVFDKVALGVSKLVLGISKVVEKIGGLIPAYAEAAKAAADLVVSTDKLEQMERDYAENSAKRQRDIAELRAKVAEKDKYSTAERRKFLEEAIALEKEDLTESKRIATEKLRLLEAEAKQNVDTSDETANAIAQARANLFNVERDYNEKMRALNKQMSTFNLELTESERKAAADRTAIRIEEARKAAEIRKEQIKNEREILAMAEDFAISRIEDETARAIATRKVQGDREIAELKARLSDRSKLTDEAYVALEALIKDKQSALDADLLQMAIDAADALGDAQIEAERERAERILEMRQELAGSPEEQLELQKQALDLQMAQELEALNITEEEKFLIRETFAKRAAQLDAEYNQSLIDTAANARNQYATQLLAVGAAAGETFGMMSDLLAKYGDDNEKAAKASKAFAIASIVADEAASLGNTARAISSAVAGASEAAAAGGPLAPILLAGYIAAMVGAVLGALGSVASTIASAKNIVSKAPAFADGGVVGGFTSHPSRLDDTYAHVGSGEMILNAAQQRELFKLANGRGGVGLDYGRMAEAVAVAVASMPAPVVVWKEMRDFVDKVATFDELTKL